MKSYRFVNLLVLGFLILAIAACQPNSVRSTSAPVSTPLPVPTQVSQNTPEATPEATLETGHGTVLVNNSYYPDKTDTYVAEVYFQPANVNLEEYQPVDESAPEWMEAIVGQKIVQIYVPLKVSIMYITSNGDPNAIQAAMNEMNFVMKLADGSYVEIRRNRDQNFGQCLVMGAAFNVEGIIVKIHDADGSDKLLQYATSGMILQISRVTPYNNEAVHYGVYVDDGTNWGLTMDDVTLKVYDDKVKQRAETKPCEDLASFVLHEKFVTQ